jgi:hypothetical protein
MRPSMILASATIALGLALTPPAKAWDGNQGVYGTVYVHHHIYYPVRYKHVYHIHRPGPYHVNVIHYPGERYALGAYGYAPQMYWRWASHRRDW